MNLLRNAARRGFNCIGRLLWLTAVIGYLLLGDRLLAANLSIPTKTVAHSANITLDVSYSAQGASVTGLQFDMQYDRSAFTISASAGPAATSAGKSLSSNVLPSGATRFLIVGFNQNVISDGVVIILSIQFATDARPGPYPLRIINPFATNSGGQGLPIAASSGRIVKTGQGSVEESDLGAVRYGYFVVEMLASPKKATLSLTPRTKRGLLS